MAADLTLETMLEIAEPAIRQVIRRRLGARSEVAEDAMQQVRLHLSDRFSRVLARGAPAIESVPAYAARAAYNVVHDQFRSRDTTRHRLKNRLRYLLGEHPRFDVWAAGSPDLLCGDACWRGTARPLASQTLALLVNGRDQLSEAAFSGTSWETMDAADWSAFLEAVFDHLDGPIELNQLVALTAVLLGVELGGPAVANEDLHSEADRPGEDSVVERRPAQVPDPADLLHLKEQLQMLWSCLQALPRPWLLAVLLNPPGPRKSERGELAVLVTQGVATMGDIRRLLSLSETDYAHLYASSVADPDTPPESRRFADLWQRLPLADTAIGKILGKSHMQVIGLRRLAVRRLARCRAETVGDL